MPSTGALRHLFAFERRPVGAAAGDGYGNTQGGYVEQFRAHGAKEPRLGGETVIAQRLSGSSVYVLTLRSSKNTRRVTPDWRVIDVRTQEICNIRSLNDPDGRRTWIDMLVDTGKTT